MMCIKCVLYLNEENIDCTLTIILWNFHIENIYFITIYVHINIVFNLICENMKIVNKQIVIRMFEW